MVYQYTFRAGEVLREIRIQKKMTQKGVAEAIGITKAYISHVELGKRPLPKYRVLIKWLEVFKIKPKYFEELVSKK